MDKEGATSTTLDDHQSAKAGKEPRMQRNTAACEVCQERKRKCDGVAPCSFCVSKNLECKFSQQRRRGPTKKRRYEENTEHALSVMASNVGVELLDKAEARKYLDLYFRIEMTFAPVSKSIETLLAPHTIPQKVQLYSALAYSAHAIGDYMKGKVFISQARMLSGSIYDSPEADTVRALMMMRKYWYLVLDFTQCAHYSSLAWSLSNLIKGGLERKVKQYVQLSAAMSDPSTTNQEKLQFLRTSCLGHANRLVLAKEELMLEGYMCLAADYLEYFHYNFLFPQEDFWENSFFDCSNVTLTEESRLRMLGSINQLQAGLRTLPAEEKSNVCVVARWNVFCPMYQSIINWRSGHIREAVECAKRCVMECNIMREANVLLLVGGFAHIFMLECMRQLFADQGETHSENQVAKILESICGLSGPKYSALFAKLVKSRKKITSIPSPPLSSTATLNTPLPPSPDISEILNTSVNSENFDMTLTTEDRLNKIDSALHDWTNFVSLLRSPALSSTSPLPPNQMISQHLIESMQTSTLSVSYAADGSYSHLTHNPRAFDPTFPTPYSPYTPNNLPPSSFNTSNFNTSNNLNNSNTPTNSTTNPHNVHLQNCNISNSLNPNFSIPQFTNNTNFNSSNTNNILNNINFIDNINATHDFTNPSNPPDNFILNSLVLSNPANYPADVVQSQAPPPPSQPNFTTLDLNNNNYNNNNSSTIFSHTEVFPIQVQDTNIIYDAGSHMDIERFFRNYPTT